MRPIGGIFALAMIVVLAGCGMFPGEKRAPWRGQAEAQCLARKLVKPSQFMQPMKAINGPGSCGMDSPFRVTAILNGTVALKSRAVFACPMISALEQWVADSVQPAARQYYGVAVAEIHFGSYACRNMNNRAGGRRSEHSFGNAADFMGMTLADGRRVNVKRGWRGSEADREFLRTIFVGACGQFGTVLGPGADAYHDDHLHMDLARHARGRTICRPVLKWSPAIPAPFEPGPGAVAQNGAQPGATQAGLARNMTPYARSMAPAPSSAGPSDSIEADTGPAHDHEGAHDGAIEGEAEYDDGGGASQGQSQPGAASGRTTTINDLLR